MNCHHAKVSLVQECSTELFCGPSALALTVCWGFPRTEARVGLGELYFIHLAVHALVSQPFGNVFD